MPDYLLFKTVFWPHSWTMPSCSPDEWLLSVELLAVLLLHIRISMTWPACSPGLQCWTIKLTNTNTKTTPAFITVRRGNLVEKIENPFSQQVSSNSGFFENFYISCFHTNVVVRCCLVQPEFEIYWSQFTMFLCEHTDAVRLCCALCQIFMGWSWEFQ